MHLCKKWLFFSLISMVCTSLSFAESLSYTGRLVNLDGSPVSRVGGVDLLMELAYSGDTSAIICSKSFTGVPLTNGVFHLKIDYATGDCGGKTIAQVLLDIPAVPPGQTVSLRVTDQTNSKTYSFHPINALPQAVVSSVARTLMAPPVGTPAGYTLRWNGTAWAPGISGTGDGTLVEIVAGTGVSVASVGSDKYSVGIANGGVNTTQLADGSVTNVKVNATAAIDRSKLAAGAPNQVVVNAPATGVMSSVAALPLTMGGTGVNTDAGARTSLGLGTAAVADIGFTAGDVLPADNIAPCLPGTKLNITALPSQTWTCVTEDLDSTKLPLAGGTMTGAINMGTFAITNLATPTNAADAATKAYVDLLSPGAGAWTVSGSDIYRNSGEVGIGTNNPGAILDVASTTSGMLIPRMTEAERDLIAAPAGGMVLYNTTSSKINFYDGAWKELGVAGPSISAITLGTGFTAPGALSSGDTINVDVGTGANEIVALNASSQLPAVDGSLLTSLNPANLSTVVPTTKGGTGLGSVGTANQILGMNSGATGLEYKTLTAGTGMSLVHAANSVTLNATGAPPTGAAGGDLSGTYPSPVVNQIQGIGVSTNDPTTGQILLYDGSKYTPASLSGDATLAGTGVLTLATVPVSKGGSGVTSLTGQGILSVNAAGTAFVSNACGTDEFLLFDSNGDAVCTDVSTLTATSFIQDGNSFGAGAVLGTDDAYPLSLETGGTTRMTILANGDVGIGGTPADKLDVTGNVALTGKLRLKSTNANYVELGAPAALTATLSFSLPGAYGTSGQALVTDGLGGLSWGTVVTGATALGGDLSGTLSNAQVVAGAVGTTELADGSVTNVKVAAGAAIARSKLASGTVDHVLINDGSGVMSSVATLPVSMGGTGINSLTASKVYVSNAAGTAFEVLPCLAYQYVSFDVLGVPTCTNLPVAASGVAGIISNSAQTLSGIKNFEDGIKVGDISTACDAASEGAIRFNSTSKKMEYCNATAWGPISIGSPPDIAFGEPSASLVKAGPVTYVVAYVGGTDPSTVSLAAGDITISGAGSAGCQVTSVTGSDYIRMVTVDNCTGTGAVAISIAAETATSTEGEDAPAAGPSSTFLADNTGPNGPVGMALGAVPTNLHSSPTVTYTAPTDIGGSTVASYEARIELTSDSSVIRDWAAHVSGNAIGSLTLLPNENYRVRVRAIDALGNLGTVQSLTWTSVNDVCYATPTPGTSCTGGTIYVGALGSDKYMTTPGGCGEIPAGQRVGSGTTAYPNADFTPTCSGTDSLMKTWSNGELFTMTGQVGYGTTEGQGHGATNIDANYGSHNTANLASITAFAQGGYHAAARYCDRLVIGGYDDWYLPNRYELNLLYVNKASIPGVYYSDWDAVYWSSTVADNPWGAWFQTFADTGWNPAETGEQLITGRNNANLIRCVRRF